MTGIASTNGINPLPSLTALRQTVIVDDRLSPAESIGGADTSRDQAVEISEKYRGLKALLDGGSDLVASYVAKLEGNGDIGLYANVEKISQNIIQAAAKQVSEQAAKAGIAADLDGIASVLAEMNRTSLDSLPMKIDMAAVHPSSLLLHLSDNDKNNFADLLTSAISSGESISKISRLAARQGFESTVEMYKGNMTSEDIGMNHEEAQAYVASLMAQNSGAPTPSVVNATVGASSANERPATPQLADGRMNAARKIALPAIPISSVEDTAYNADSVRGIIESIENSGWK